MKNETDLYVQKRQFDGFLCELFNYDTILNIDNAIVKEYKYDKNDDECSYFQYVISIKIDDLKEFKEKYNNIIDKASIKYEIENEDFWQSVSIGLKSIKGCEKTKIGKFIFKFELSLMYNYHGFKYFNQLNLEYINKFEKFIKKFKREAMAYV